VSFHELIFRVHAIERMFERDISEVDIRDVLENGKVIESYPDDAPFPSRLMLGWCDGRAIHVLASDDSDNQVTVIITVYQPDPARWDATFTRRR